MADLLNN